jgi:hypothetical protein
MNTRDEIRQVQNEQGWTDETLGELALDYVLDRFSVDFLLFLQTVQQNENDYDVDRIGGQ